MKYYHSLDTIICPFNARQILLFHLSFCLVFFLRKGREFFSPARSRRKSQAIQGMSALSAALSSPLFSLIELAPLTQSVMSEIERGLP